MVIISQCIQHAHKQKIFSHLKVAISSVVSLISPTELDMMPNTHVSLT